MSHGSRRSVVARQRARAPIFAALGDRTRLSLVGRLSKGRAYSVSKLTQGSKMSRQAIRKHLRVLENVGIVHGIRRGRENLFAFDPAPIEEIQKYLEFVSGQWDQALARLKSFVEQ